MESAISGNAGNADATLARLARADPFLRLLASSAAPILAAHALTSLAAAPLPRQTPLLPAEVMYALTAIPGVGRRMANVLCKKAEVNMNKRAGELSADEIERLVAIL